MSTAHLLLAASSALLITAHAAAMPVLGQSDTFQDGTAQGWGNGQQIVRTQTTNLADAGPAGVGDNALGLAFSLRAVVQNTDTRWRGDYTAAGVTAIRLDINNTSDSALNLRLGLVGPGDAGSGGSGDTWITDSQQVIANSGWVTLTFDLTADDLIQTGSQTNPNAVLADVAQLRLIDNAAEDFRGATGTGGFQVDNITAVPEPGSLALLAFGGLALARRRRRA